jgi:hypothetical protein
MKEDECGRRKYKVECGHEGGNEGRRVWMVLMGFPPGTNV